MTTEQLKLEDVKQECGLGWTGKEAAEGCLFRTLETLFRAEDAMRADKLMIAKMKVDVARNYILEKIPSLFDELHAMTGIPQFVAVCKMIAKANGVDLDAVCADARRVASSY